MTYTGRTWGSNDGCLHAGETEKPGAEGGRRPQSGAKGLEDYGESVERSFIPESILPGSLHRFAKRQEQPSQSLLDLHTAIQRLRDCFGQQQGRGWRVAQRQSTRLAHTELWVAFPATQKCAHRKPQAGRIRHNVVPQERHRVCIGCSPPHRGDRTYLLILQHGPALKLGQTEYGVS